jgi:hypothetical protein
VAACRTSSNPAIQPPFVFYTLTLKIAAMGGP